MKKLCGVSLVLAAGISGLALVASASGTPAVGTKVIRPHGLIVALALDRNRVAYALGDKVFVWNLGTRKRSKVSGRQTRADAGKVLELSIAGSQVAWYMNAFGNLESDDYLFTSSLLKPKERLVATAVRMGDNCGAGAALPLWPPPCAGKGLGGLVASGNRILVNRWTADATPALTHAGLYALNGTRLKAVAIGTGTAKAVAADSQRVVVLHPDGSLGLYSAAGESLFSVTPTARVEEVALSGRNLVVLEPGGKLALYDARTGSLRKAFTLQGARNSSSALDAQGNIVVYSSGSSIRALNLSSGKDRPVGRLPGRITLARIDSTGLVYTNDFWTDSHGYADKLVFLPFKQVAAAVS